MSMENAILEHASALRELSAAVRSLVDATMGSVIAGAVRIEGMPAALAAPYGATQDPVDTKAAELADATEKRAAAAREAQQKDAAANVEAKKSAAGATESTTAPAPADEVKPDAGEQAAKDMEESVRKVEEAARAEAAPLDYAKDVKPVLLALVKAKQKPALVDLLAKYNAKNGEQIKADDFAAIVADANALIAA